MTHPASESLIPHALGADDPTIARHLEGCPTCRAEVDKFRQAAGALQSQATFQGRNETPGCLDEVKIAAFVDGRLSPEARAPVVAHLLTCARCRSLVVGTGRLTADETLAHAGDRSGRRWPRWSLPLGIAAAAALLLLLLLPRYGGDGLRPGLRDTTTQTTPGAPVPITPRASVARVNRFVWSSVRGAARYRLRLYDDGGAVLWTVETADTLLAASDSVKLMPRDTYFWKVEAQTEWQRWAASELVEFQIGGPSP